MTANYWTRPLSDRTWLRPDHARVVSGFTASWADTIDRLVNEVFKLQSKGMPDPVIEVDVPERAIRVDGGLRADAVASSPAVVVAFESIHGPLMYRCDRYSGTRSVWHNGRFEKPLKPWQSNVRAVALTLEALRSVDRYGATRSGEQYTGWKALPPGSGLEPSGMTVELAQKIILVESSGDLVNGQPRVSWAELVRRARANTHPDRNDGDRSRWNAVDEAEQVLRRAGKI